MSVSQLLPTPPPTSAGLTAGSDEGRALSQPMRSPTYASHPDRFMLLFRFGVPQVDLWRPDRHRDIYPPEEPRRPKHRRPDRVLPPEPREWEAVRDECTEAERAMYADVRGADAMAEANVSEAFHMSDGDCLTGHIMSAEYAVECVENGQPPAWWDPTVHDAEVLVGLYRGLLRADTAIDKARAGRRAIVSAIQSAPETDPEWRAYDEAMAAWPSVRAAYLERVRVRAVELTGYASEAEAAAEWTARAEHDARGIPFDLSAHLYGRKP